MILSANRPVPGFDVPTVEFDDLECKPPNSMIANADHQITWLGGPETRLPISEL